MTIISLRQRRAVDSTTAQLRENSKARTTSSLGEVSRSLRGNGKAENRRIPNQSILKMKDSETRVELDWSVVGIVTPLKGGVEPLRGDYRITVVQPKPDVAVNEQSMLFFRLQRPTAKST